MKPLYWTRIQIPVSQVTQTEEEKVIWEDLDDIKIEEDEFDDLFSRAVVKPKKKEEKKVEKPRADKPTSIIDSKRSQNIGILLKSTHIDIPRLEEVVYNFELSIEGEILQQIQEIQATPEELTQLKCHVDLAPDKQLDTPDQFLLDLSSLSHFNERITCIMFQSKFGDSVAEIENRLNNIRSCCDFLTTSMSMRTTMAVTLACGNYMNGGNRQRGQADGFLIDILPKIKDVKSKDNSLNLLAYIVRFCIVKYDENKGTPEASLPVPEPSDLEKCQHMDFETQRGEVEKVRREHEKAKRNTEKIFEKSPDDLKEPFNTKMTEFLESADNQLKELSDLVEDCVKKFIECMKFYKFMPKVGKMEDCKPEDFFSLWYPFCNDYKNIWKKEQVRIQKEILKEEREKHKKKKESLQNVEVKQTPKGGLKDKLKRRKTQGNVTESSPSTTPSVGLKEKLMRRKMTKSLPEGATDNPEEEDKPEPSPVDLTDSAGTSDTNSSGLAANGLKAKLQRRKNKQASASSSSDQ